MVALVRRWFFQDQIRFGTFQCFLMYRLTVVGDICNMCHSWLYMLVLECHHTLVPLFVFVYQSLCCQNDR